MPINFVNKEMYWNPYCYKCLTNSTGSNGMVWYTCIATFSGWSKTISLNIFDKDDGANNFKKNCDTDSLLNSEGVCIQKQCGLGYAISPDEDKTCLRSSDYEEIGPPLIIFSGGDSNVTNFDICMVGQHPVMALYVFMNTSMITNYSNNNIVAHLQNVFHDMVGLWLPRYSNSSVTVFKAKGFLTPLNLTKLQNIVNNTNDNNIIKAVLTGDDKNITTHIYGFDLHHTFDGPPRICSSFEIIESNDDIKNKTNCYDFGNLSIKYKLEISPTGKITRTRLRCEIFHLHSNCFRKKLLYRNFSLFSHSSKDWIKITTQNNTTKTYRATEYEPTEDTGLQICINMPMNTSGQQQIQAKYVWQSAIDEASYVISMVGTILSIFAHTTFVFCFTRYSALRNKGGMYILVLVIFLMISDILSIPTLSKDFHQNATADVCKWFGIMLYWSLITVCGWSVVVAVDIGKRFAMTFLSVGDDDPMKTLYKRIAYNLSFTCTVAVTVIVLNETGTLDFDFKTNCWIGQYKALLAFYFVPMLLVYFLCLVMLITVLWSLNQAHKRNKKVLKDTKHKDNALLSIGMKLIVILGITECLGLIQIRKMNLNESEAALNATFGLIYNLTRSLRGVLIFAVYLMNERTLKLIKSPHHQTKGTINTIHLSTSSI